MYKNNYLRILFFIEDRTAIDGKFDFDKALDGTYDFNVNDVSILYELVHIIESMAASNETLKCTEKMNSLLKEFKYQYNKKVYKVSRCYTNDESTYITRSTFDDAGDFVPEQELMEHVDKKCKLIRDRLNMIYEERARLGLQAEKL